MQSHLQSQRACSKNNLLWHWVNLIVKWGILRTYWLIINNIISLSLKISKYHFDWQKKGPNDRIFQHSLIFLEGPEHMITSKSVIVFLQVASPQICLSQFWVQSLHLNTSKRIYSSLTVYNMCKSQLSWSQRLCSWYQKPLQYSTVCTIQCSPSHYKNGT